MVESATPLPPRKASTRGVVGRPATLTESAIVTAALHIGLDQLTIRKLAAALGVAASSIYEYFSSRDEIIAAAIHQALASLELPVAPADTWREFVEEFAASIVRNRIAHPEYIRFHLEGNDTSAIMAMVIRHFTETMGRFGVSAGDALWLLRRLGPLTMSVAVEMARQRNFGARGLDPAHTDAVAALGDLLDTEGLAQAHLVIGAGDAEAIYSEELDLLLDRFAARLRDRDAIPVHRSR